MIEVRGCTAGFGGKGFAADGACESIGCVGGNGPGGACAHTCAEDTMPAALNSVIARKLIGFRKLIILASTLPPHY